MRAKLCSDISHKKKGIACAAALCFNGDRRASNPSGRLGAEENRQTGEWHGKSEEEPQEVEKAGKHQTAYAFPQIVSEFDGRAQKIRQLF
jgi:hypothetical protein